MYLKLGSAGEKKSVSDLVMAVLNPVYFENNKDLVMKAPNATKTK